MTIPHPRHSACSAELRSFRTYEFDVITVIRRRSQTHQCVSKVNITRLKPGKSGASERLESIHCIVQMSGQCVVGEFLAWHSHNAVSIMEWVHAICG